MIEVEIRGPLTTADHERLMAEFSATPGVEMRKQERILLDLSGPLENRQRDVRVRATDGVS